MNSKEFSLLIEGVVKEKRPISYMDAIVWYCETNKIEIETVKRLVSKNLKEKIKAEALNANMACPRGSITISLPPRLANCLKKVAATGWFSVGFAPITIATSAVSIWLKVAVTAPDPTFSISAATDEAGHRPAQ